MPAKRSISAGTDVPDALWNRLYDATEEVRRLEPWKLVYETQCFFLDLPGVEGPSLVSFLGGHGEYRAVVVYLGNEGQARFHSMHTSDSERSLGDAEDAMALTFECPQIHCHFTGANRVPPEQKALTKRLGRTYRGATAHPVFERHGGTYAPALVNAQEAEWLLVTLEQTAALIAERDPASLPDLSEGAVALPFRERTPAGWRTSQAVVDFSDYEFPVLPAAPVAKGPVLEEPLEVCLHFSPRRFEGPDGRAAYCYMLLLVGARSGCIYGVELVQGGSGEGAGLATLPAALARQFAKCGRPPSVIVAGFRAEGLFGATLDGAGIPHMVGLTPACEEAVASLRRNGLA